MKQEFHSSPLSRLIDSLLAGLEKLAVCFLTWIRPTRPLVLPNSLKPPVFNPDRIPRLAPINLTPETVDSFVRWVAAVPVSQAQLIRDQIAAARNDERVLGALLTHIHTLPVADFGRHILLISILGELRHPQSVESLGTFIELPRERIFSNPQTNCCGSSTTYDLDYAASLQARAVEMLAFIRTREALEKVLSLVSQHPSKVVRLAALDAYVFNHGDNPEAIERARSVARPDEAKFVDRARRERGGDPHAFEAKVQTFYRKFPEEIAPNPKFRNDRNRGQQDVTVPSQRKSV
jgi:hypothetical protein